MYLIFQSHKMAWPFLEPVREADAPGYYKVVTRPMGKIASLPCIIHDMLSTVSNRRLLHRNVLLVVLTLVRILNLTPGAYAGFFNGGGGSKVTSKISSRSIL